MSGEDKAPVLPPDGISQIKVSVGPDKEGIIHAAATRKQYPDFVEYIHYTHCRPAGRGTFGTVTRAKLLNTNESVAVKKVWLRTDSDLNELTTLRELNHCNIIELKYFFRTRLMGCV